MNVIRTKVKIRFRPISNHRKSIRLDYWPRIRNPVTNKLSRYETLGMVIFDKPRDSYQKEHNRTMLAQAQAICGIRQQMVINEEFGFLDTLKPKANFLKYFYNCAIRNGNSWITAFKHFEMFMKGACCFGEITLDLCLRYREYIQGAAQIRSPERTLSANTAALYFQKFKYTVFFAYRDKWLRENVSEFLDYIEPVPTQRSFLTPDELMKLSQTPCESNVLKRASLFACTTGLRYSDVKALKWDNIEPSLMGTGYCMRIVTEKTDTEVTLPLSAEALQLCGVKSEGEVFAGLNRNLLKTPLERWLAAAGITKHITFHCFRHTYAVLQLASGTDIYTVSKMLTHKHVSTTEIYLHLLEETKIKTIDKIRIDIDPALLAAGKNGAHPSQLCSGM